MKIYDDVLIYLTVINGSIWGVLARKGLGVLTTYDGANTDSALWANFAACFILAGVSQLPKTPFSIGISSGFCGTLSSFSAIILDLFTKSANVVEGVTYKYPNPGYGVMEFLSILIVESGVSIFGFILGKHVSGKVVVPKKYHQNLGYLCAVVGIVAYIIIIVLVSVKEAWRTWCLMVIFAPIGAATRYHLSQYNTPTFPTGTYMANVWSCIAIGVFTILSRGKKKNLGTNLTTRNISCRILLAAIDGYCGSLSTISTFISELFTLPRAIAYKYAISSFSVCFILVTLILGTYTWTVGLNDPVCTY